MPGNLLQSIGLSPEWFKGVMGNVANGIDVPPDEAPAAPPQPAAAPVNLLQGLGYDQPAAAPQIPQTGAPANASPAPKSRRSLLDSVGRIADVLAKVGGADALYQPTLDAREDREIALGDHARSVDLEKLKLALAGQQVEGGQNALDDTGRARIQQAVRGTQALLAANPQADITKVFPLLASRAGLNPEQAAGIATDLAANPGLLDGLAGFDDAGDKFGGSVVYAKGPDGRIVAFQPNLKGGKGRAILPEGFTAVDPLKFVDTGDKQVGVGTRSGEVGTTLDKGMDPDKVADRGSREGIARRNNQTARDIAAMPARSKAAAGGGANSSMAKQADTLLGELSGIYEDLNKSGAMVNPNNSTAGNIMSRLRSSGAGQLVEGAVGTQAQTLRDRVASIRPALMQSLAKATGMTGKQLDSNADVKLFMQTITDPSASYQANKAAIAGLRTFLASNAKADTPARQLPPRVGAPAKPAARRPAGKPTVTNW